MDTLVPVIAGAPEGVSGKLESAARLRWRAHIVLTLAFWAVNFGLATLVNAFGHAPNFELIIAARSGLCAVGLALCFVLFRMQEAAGEQIGVRIRALAVAVPFAVSLCALGSLAIARYVAGEAATAPEVVRTFARWFWFFAGWSAASIALDYYFQRHGESQPSNMGASDANEGADAGNLSSAGADAAKSLKLWIGFEVTADVTRESRASAQAFCGAFNEELSTRPWQSPITHFDVLLVIMNPQIAPPVAEEFSLWRDRFECRVRIDFQQWMLGNPDARIGLIKEAVSKALKAAIDVIDPGDRLAFQAALERAAAQTIGQEPLSSAAQGLPAAISVL